MKTQIMPIFHLKSCFSLPRIDLLQEDFLHEPTLKVFKFPTLL